MYHNVYKSTDNVLYGLHVYWDFHSSINDIDNSVRQGDCYNTPINCVPRTQQVPQVCPTEVLVVTQAILCHLGYPKVSQHMLKIPTVINYVTISDQQFIWLEPGVREMADEGDSFLSPGVQYLVGYRYSMGSVLFWDNVHLHHHKLHKSLGGAEVHKGVPPKLCSTHISHWGEKIIKSMKLCTGMSYYDHLISLLLKGSWGFYSISFNLTHVIVMAGYK